MSCEIDIQLEEFESDDTEAPEQGLVIATPYVTPQFTNGVMEIKPRRAATNPAGLAKFHLPWQSESSPSDQSWVITMPGQVQFKGVVPEGVAGPLTIKQLLDSHGWALVDPASPAGITTIQAYQTVQANGTARTQRNILNFGPGLTAVDDPTNNRTTVDVNVSADVTPTAVLAALAAVSAPVVVNGQKVEGVAAGEAGTDAVNKTQMDAGDAASVTTARVQAAIAAIVSALSVNNQKITSLATPTADTDAATKKYVDDNAGGGGGMSNPASADLDMATHAITGASDLGADTVTLTSGTGIDSSGNILAAGELSIVGGGATWDGSVLQFVLHTSTSNINGGAASGGIFYVASGNSGDGSAGICLEYPGGKMGFWGHAPAVRATAASITTLADLKTYLVSIGFLS